MVEDIRRRNLIMEYILRYGLIEQMGRKLREEEKSRATIDKYKRDVRAFISYAGEGTELTKETVICFKEYLGETYEISSANSMLAAVNYFMRFIERFDCVVKAFKVQKETFRKKERELTREEYYRLLDTARQGGNDRLLMLMQTICSTGIRIGELRFVTVEALYSRRAKVSLKGKSRTVILPLPLCVELRRYVREKQIKSGSIFVTRSGKPMDRSNVLHAMKKLCRKAEVPTSKVFPHNLRHLFAVTYYMEQKNLSHLADLLGHSNINTTRIYTLISCEEQERQLDGLGLCVDAEKPHNICYEVTKTILST